MCSGRLALPCNPPLSSQSVRWVESWRGCDAAGLQSPDWPMRLVAHPGCGPITSQTIKTSSDWWYDLLLIKIQPEDQFPEYWPRPVLRKSQPITNHQYQFGTNTLISQFTNTNSLPRPTFMAKPPQFRVETKNFDTGRAMYGNNTPGWASQHC